MAEVYDWAERGESILRPDVLERVEHTLTQEGPIVVWHKFYRAARGGEAFAFNAYDDFKAYLGSKTHPGDKRVVWKLVTQCAWVKIAEGKCPDEHGRTPRLGAY